MDRRDYLDYWTGVRERVRAFEAQDDRGLIFGARTRGYGHDYAILPTVPEADLIDFERRTGLTLPLEYRTFLEAFGAGGAGPDYGIRDFRGDTFQRDFSTPFPCTETVWGPDEECPEDELVWQLPGLAYICNHGCGSESLIELNGPDPGRMWCEWQEGLLKGGRFHEFYRDWVDSTEELLEQYRHLVSIADRDPPLDPNKPVTLDDIVGIMGCEHRTIDHKDADGNPDGGTWLYFGQKSVGRVLLNKDNEMVRIEVYGDRPR